MKINLSSLKDFTAVEIVGNEIGFVQYVDGNIHENKLLEFHEDSFIYIHNSIGASVLVSFNAGTTLGTLSSQFERITGNNFRPTTYISLSSWTKYAVGELNLGSACLHFNIPQTDSNSDTKGWNALQKAELSAKLAVKLSETYEKDKHQLNFG